MIKYLINIADSLKKRGFLFFPKLLYKFCSFSKYHLPYSAMAISNIYNKTGQYKKGIKLFERLCNKYPNNDRFAFQLAYFYSLSGKNSEAIEIYRRLLDKMLISNEIVDYQLIGNLIDLYNEVKEYEKSLELIEMFLKDKNKKDIESYVYYNAGTTFLRLENYKKAVKYYDISLSIKKDPNALFYKGVSLKHMKKDKEALSCFLKSLKLTQDNYLKGVIQSETGGIYYLMEDYDKASEYFQKAVDNKFKSADTLFYKGVCLEHMKKYKEAISCFLKSSKLPQETYSKDEIKNEIGRVYYLMENYNKALEYFEEAVKNGAKDDINSFFNKGLCLKHMKKYEEALSCFFKSLNLSQDKYLKGETQGEIGDIYYLMEDYDKALKYFEKTINNGLKEAEKRYNELKK